MIIEGLGIPYMGSKRKLAPQIINAILKDNPDVNIYGIYSAAAVL